MTPAFVTFDCYGTLVDWRGGIAGAFARAAAADGVRLDADDILRAYHEAEPRIQSERYRPYREVLSLVAGEVAARLGWRCPPERTAFLPESVADWTPFPDTNPALERLREAGCRLGILSNVDDDLLAATRRHLTADFDLVVTAQQVRSYKPAPAHFRQARASIGTAAWLHAAQSYFHDVEPCLALGIPVGWVNRLGERAPGRSRPDLEVADLTALAEAIVGRGEPG